MARTIRSETELAQILARPGFRIASQIGGEKVNTSTPGSQGGPSRSPETSATPGTLTLPWPPSGQHSHGHHGSRRYLLPEVIAYRDAVANLAHGYSPTKGPYRLFVHLSPPDKRKRDADNAIKAVLDALVHAAYVEDDAISFMRELHVTTDADRYGWVKVRVEAVA